jgi:hypothetical protein
MNLYVIFVDAGSYRPFRIFLTVQKDKRNFLQAKIRPGRTGKLAGHSSRQAYLHVPDPGARLS